MRTVFRNHQEVCNIWARQKQLRGVAGNITFTGTVIFSYGWWPMAKIFVGTTPLGDVVLLRSESYSNSTSKHLLHTWRAVYGQYKIFHVPEVLVPIASTTGPNGSLVAASPLHEINIKAYVRRARKAADRFWNSRVYFKRYAQHYWQSVVTEAKEYAKHFNCEHLLPPLFGLELKGQLASKAIEKTFTHHS